MRLNGSYPDRLVEQFYLARGVRTVQIDSFARLEAIEHQNQAAGRGSPAYKALMAIKSRFKDPVPTFATYRGQGVLRVVERSPRVRSYGHVFDALPLGLVTLRIRGISAHDSDDADGCPVTRVLNALSQQRYEYIGALAILKDVRTIDIAALPGACERCKLRVKAFQDVCDSRNIALTTSNTLREVRHMSSSLAATDSSARQDVARARALPPNGASLQAVGVVDALREVCRRLGIGRAHSLRCHHTALLALSRAHTVRLSRRGAASRRNRVLVLAAFRSQSAASARRAVPLSRCIVSTRDALDRADSRARSTTARSTALRRRQRSR